MNRRNFFKTMAAGVAAASPLTTLAGQDMGSAAPGDAAEAASGQGAPDLTSPMQGARILIPIYGKSRFHFNPKLAQIKACMALIDAGSGAVQYLPAQVANLHAMVRATAHNDAGLIFGVGQNEDLGIFHADLTLRDVIRFEGVAMRGHGVTHEDGVLITAQDTTKKGDENNGLLLYLTATGMELGRYQTGGLHPHEIVDCGDYYAVAHYGVTPAPAINTSDQLPISYRQNSPVRSGVSFLDKKTLEIVAFHRTAENAISGHMTALTDGSVLVNTGNITQFQTEAALYEQAQSEGVELTREEVRLKRYASHSGFYRVHPTRGVVQDISCPAKQMRGGQSVTRDPQLNWVASTWSESHTIRIDMPSGEHKILNSLDFGVPLPRGCVFIPGTGSIVITGQRDNAAVIDVAQGVLIQRYGIPLSKHSHAHWFAKDALSI